MSRQIAVRLPNDLVEFIDQVVDSGQARNRAAVVARAVYRERRRLITERDVATLTNAGPDPEFDQLAELAATIPLPDLA